MLSYAFHIVDSFIVRLSYCSSRWQKGEIKEYERAYIHWRVKNKKQKQKTQGNKKKLLFYFFFHGFFFFLQADNKSSLTPALIAMRYVDTVMWQKLKWKKREYVKILHVHEVRLFGGASVRHLKKEMQLGISR